MSRFCKFPHIMCKFTPLLGSESLKMWPWEEEGRCNLTQLAGRFCKSPSLCTQEVGADTQTSGLADDQRPSGVGSETVRNRGATPKCHHSCKTAEHKSQITEICSTRPPVPENRAGLRGDCPSVQWKESCRMSTMSWVGLKLHLEGRKKTAWSP